MAWTTKPTSDLIRFVRGTKELYQNINKRNDTLYFVYENEESTTGELYLGSKQIGDGSAASLTELISGTVADGSLLIYDDATESWTAATLEDAVRVMTGATETAAGQSGLVPTPQAGDLNKFLRGDGTWAAASSLTPVDGTSLELNTDNELTIKGFNNAPVGSLLQKTETGLTWTTAPTVSSSITYKKVETLEDVTENNTIYFVPNESGTDNAFDEYMYIDGKAELLGSTANVNLSNYTPLTTFNSTVGNLYTSINAKADKTDVDALSETIDAINERLVWQEIISL